MTHVSEWMRRQQLHIEFLERRIKDLEDLAGITLKNQIKHMQDIKLIDALTGKSIDKKDIKDDTH